MRSPVQPVKYVCAELATRAATPATTKSATTIDERRAGRRRGSRRRRRAWRGTAARAPCSVAASSEPSASAVRRLYGAASRASVATRRAVRRHDQSATSRPALGVRWEPGCQTLTRRAVLRGSRRARRRDAPTSARPPTPQPRCGKVARAVAARDRAESVPTRPRAGSRPRLHALRELALEQPVLVDLAVDRRSSGSARRACRARRPGRRRARRARRRARSSTAGGR